MRKAKPIKIKAYIAAGYSRKEEVAAIAKELESVGVTITSNWHKERPAPQTGLNDNTESFLRRTARKDIQELTAANYFVMLTVDPDKPFKRGGSCVENGFAIARGLPTMIIGPRQHIFHYLPGIKKVDTVEQAKKWMIRMQEG